MKRGEILRQIFKENEVLRLLSGLSLKANPRTNYVQVFGLLGVRKSWIRIRKAENVWRETCIGFPPFSFIQKAINYIELADQGFLAKSRSRMVGWLVGWCNSGPTTLLHGGHLLLCLPLLCLGLVASNGFQLVNWLVEWYNSEPTTLLHGGHLILLLCLVFSWSGGWSQRWKNVWILRIYPCYSLHFFHLWLVEWFPTVSWLHSSIVDIFASALLCLESGL